MKVKLKLRIIISLTQIKSSLPVGKCVKNSDDHERNLSGEEHTNDYNQHQGSTLGIPLLSAFSDNAPTRKDILSDPCFYKDLTTFLSSCVKKTFLLYSLLYC